ncbi:CHASE2 domain-containing protein, partial [Methylophaga sp. UBA3996]
MRLSDSHRSWIIGSFLVLFFVAAGFFLSEKKTLQRLDLLIYDVMLPLHSPKMSEQIVIIAIDDASIRALGRWPWSRHQHAKLLQELQKMSPKAIGIDLIFSEPEINSNADQSLAQAMLQNQHTVLVVAPIKETSDSLIVERLPIPLLASAAAALGHVDVELDIDGTNRHFYLYAGLGNPHWPNVALAMLKVGKDAGDYGSPSQPVSEYSVAGWVRSHKMMLSFTSADNLAKRISFKDVLEGRVDPELIRDKYVLIGATSAGIGDMISTPASRSHQRMPGVEIISQEMNTLLQGSHLYELSPSMQSGITILLIIVSVGAIV